jgi:hypothetical protein
MLRSVNVTKGPGAERALAGVGSDARVAQSLVEPFSWTFVVNAERWSGCQLSIPFFAYPRM